MARNNSALNFWCLDGQRQAQGSNKMVFQSKDNLLSSL